MVLDVGQDVLVVRESAGQRGIVRMRLGVIPIQPLSGPFDSITVCLDDPSCKVQVFPHAQYDIGGELQAAAEFGKGWPTPDHDKGRAFD